MGVLEGSAQRMHHNLGDRDCNNSKKVTEDKDLTGRRAALVLGGGKGCGQEEASTFHCLCQSLVTEGQCYIWMHSWHIGPTDRCIEATLGQITGSVQVADMEKNLINIS